MNTVCISFALTLWSDDLLYQLCIALLQNNRTQVASSNDASICIAHCIYFCDYILWYLWYMFDTFPRYDVFKNTAIYFFNVNIYYNIDLWTSPTYSCCLAMQDVPLLCAWLTTYPKHGPCMILQRNVKTRLCLRDKFWPFLSSSVGAARLRASGGY